MIPNVTISTLELNFVTPSPYLVLKLEVTVKSISVEGLMCKYPSQNFQLYKYHFF